MRFLICCSFLLFQVSSIAQLAALEDSLFLYRKLTFDAQNDSDRIGQNNKLNNLFISTCKQEGAFDYPFSKLKSISILTSPDGKLRLITWNVQLEDFTQLFNGIALLQSKKQTKVYSLTTSIAKPDWENFTSDTNNWIGAVYYDIIQLKKGKNPSYTLLAWKGKDRLISQKMVEILSVENDNLMFGEALIKHGSSYKKRALFSYPAEMKFTLRYDEAGKQIIFDRIAPSDPRFAGNYANYTSQFVFDAYRLEKGLWKLVQDIATTMPERQRPIPSKPKVNLVP